MALETIRSPISLSDYITLSDHQETTPASFYDGKPVLYYHATGAKAWLHKSKRGKLPFFPADLENEPTAPENGAVSAANEKVEQVVDVFVNSANLALFSPTAACGITIPYHRIGVHGVRILRDPSTGATYPSIFLELELSDGGGWEDDCDTVDLTLIPPAQSQSQTHARSQSHSTTQGQNSQSASSTDAASSEPKSEAAKMYEAISACSRLNPDPNIGQGEEDDDEEGDWDDDEGTADGDAEDDPRIVFERDVEAVNGIPGAYTAANNNSTNGLPPPFPGSSGWITAENVHEFFDENGNWLGRDGEELPEVDIEIRLPGEEGENGDENEGLGEGAGSRRPREEVPDGDGADSAESKRPRLE